MTERGCNFRKQPLKQAVADAFFFPAPCLLLDYADLMPRKSLLLFLVVGIIWGTPYFFIEIALEHFDTTSLVFARVFLGAVILLPIAMAKGMLTATLKAWPAVVAFAGLEMIGPWFLIPEAQKDISSSLASLLVTTVPFIAAFFVGLLGDKSAWHPLTVLGLVVGLAGVIALVGIDAFSGVTPLAPILMMLGAALGYAVAPIVVNRMPQEVPTLGVIAVSLAIVSIVYAPFAAVSLPQNIAAGPSWQAWVALLVLGAVCSALAFVLFFALIRQIGPARASLITYVNLAVAAVLGVVFLAEPITIGIVVGFPLVVAGSYLASRQRQALVRKGRRIPKGEEIPETL